jgi:Protein of unknown function (DUF2934)
MVRDVASTRIPASESPLLEPPVLKPVANPPARAKINRPLSLVPHRLTAAERHLRICELAYRKAELRGFEPGAELEDWLEAEREVDAGRYWRESRSPSICGRSFCFIAAVWREVYLGVAPPPADIQRLPTALLLVINGFLVLISLAALVGVWMIKA